MIEDIRKKHEDDQREYGSEESSAACLTIGDVDALFAALDAERGKVEKLKKQKWYFDIENHTCLTCGGAFDLPENMYRCIDCGAFLHKFCMKQHCGGKDES